MSKYVLWRWWLILLLKVHTNCTFWLQSAKKSLHLICVRVRACAWMSAVVSIVTLCMPMYINIYRLLMLNFTRIMENDLKTSSHCYITIQDPKNCRYSPNTTKHEMKDRWLLPWVQAPTDCKIALLVRTKIALHRWPYKNSKVAHNTTIKLSTCPRYFCLTYFLPLEFMEREKTLAPPLTRTVAQQFANLVQMSVTRVIDKSLQLHPK